MLNSFFGIAMFLNITQAVVKHKQNEVQFNYPIFHEDASVHWFFDQGKTSRGINGMSAILMFTFYLL